jgi:hypothetical protein
MIGKEVIEEDELLLLPFTKPGNPLTCALSSVIGPFDQTECQTQAGHMFGLYGGTLRFKT